MTTQLAIGYLAAGRRNVLPRGASVRTSSAHVTEHDSISGRPAIPQAVISWSDDDLQGNALPVGAGDPAVAVDGPPSFRVLSGKRAGRVGRTSVDAVMFGVLVAMLLGLAGAVAKVGEQPNIAWAPRDAVALAAVGAGKVPFVDVRVISIDPVTSSQPAPAAARLASTAKPAAAN